MFVVRCSLFGVRSPTRNSIVGVRSRYEDVLSSRRHAIAVVMSRKNFQDLLFDDVSSARPVHQMTISPGIYTISGARGLVLQPVATVGASGTVGGAYRTLIP